MGAFLELHKMSDEDIIVTKEIDVFLRSIGFRDGYYGLTHGLQFHYRKHNGEATYKVLISKKEIYIDLEYDCSDWNTDFRHKITEANIKSMSAFIEFLDEIYKDIRL